MSLQAVPLQLRGLRMSDPSIKGVKQSPSRPSSRRSSSSSKQRSVAAKGPASKPLAKRKTMKKAPARKADQADTSLSAKSKTAKTSPRAGTTTKRTVVKGGATAKKSKPAVKTPVRKAKTTKTTKVEAPIETKPAASRSRSVKPQRVVPAKVPAVKTPAPQPVRNQVLDESAALQAFELAYREFSRGRFSEARELFRALLDKHSGGSDVVARARTYLTITESRLKIDLTLPKDADSLYDRGVIELNRGQFVAAQEMFEKALSSEPGGAHIHYGLAATRARLGAIESALNSLLKAIDLQPTLRLRAQHDIDLISLRNEPEFDRLVFSHRS
jgi:tetratricopeptide (TPR) repeat protein